jgi:hypothetical protein
MAIDIGNAPLAKPSGQRQQPWRPHAEDHAQVADWSRCRKHNSSGIGFFILFAISGVTNAIGRVMNV